MFFTTGLLFTSLAPGRWNCYLEHVDLIILQLISRINILSISHEISPRGMPQDLTDDKVNIGSGNDLVTSGNKPLPEPMLTPRKWVQICLGGWLLTVDCIVYLDIVNTFKSSYHHSILSIAIIKTPECQHCIVWQWAAFWSRGNGKFPTIKQRKFDLNLSGKLVWFWWKVQHFATNKFIFGN